MERQSTSRRRRNRFYPFGQWNSNGKGEEVLHSSGLQMSSTSPQAKTELRTTREKVMDFARSHQSYKLPGLSEALTSLPKFDDISRYGISEEQETRLWRLETERLIMAVERGQSQEPFGLTLGDSWPANRTCLEHLSVVADQAMCNLNICRFDNQLLLFENHKEIFQPTMFVAARREISRRFDPQKPNREADKPDQNAFITPRQSRELYCALIDYVTAVVARYACHAIPNEYWHTRALAGLAKCAAKVKFLIVNPERFAHQSLDNGQDILAMDEARQFLGIEKQAEIDAAVDAYYEMRNYRERSSHIKRTGSLLRGGDEEEGFYFLEMFFSTSWSSSTLESILDGLKGSVLSGYPVDAFDMCSIVYRTGWNDVPTLLSQDRDGEIKGTSARGHLRSLYDIFCTARQAADTIARDQTKESYPATTTAGRQGRSDEPVGVHLILSMQDDVKQVETESSSESTARDGDEVIHLDLRTLSEVVSVIVPVLCTQSGALMILNDTSRLVATMSSISNSVDFSSLPAPKFSAFVSLRSRAYDSLQASKDEVDFRPVSRCLMAQSRLYTWNLRPFGTAGNAQSTRTWLEQPAELKRRQLNEAEVKLQSLEKTVRNWVIEENVIIVMRLEFVVKVMTLCGVLVVGGILAGVLLGDRLKGVDPFNITTFAWVMAGFITLVSKSLFVGEWPWRDFLRGRVPCRSVSELERVTGVDAQDIMEYLLAKESYTILDTKGPFNRLFTRRSTDGFSIDVKMELRTLVASGIIVVKVATHMGPALVCLDIRTGADGRFMVKHDDGPRKAERILGCFEFPEGFNEKEDVPLQELTESMSWTRILGVYHRPYKKFR